jgi:hypothetical protein
MLLKVANGGICLQGNGLRSGLGPEGCRLGLGAIRKGQWRSKIGVGIVELIELIELTEGIEGIELILLAVEALYENATAPLRLCARLSVGEVTGRADLRSSHGGRDPALRTGAGAQCRGAQRRAARLPASQIWLVFAPSALLEGA